VSSIAIDYTPAYEQGGGIGRVTRDLVAALAQHDTETNYRLFVAGAFHHQLSPAPGTNFRWQPVPIAPLWLARLWHRAKMPLPVNWFTGKIHLYHATDFVLPPVSAGIKTLVTIHDVSFVRVPAAASPTLKAYLDKVVPESIWRADHVIAVSQATKKDIIELYGTAPEKISVVLHGIDTRFRRIENLQQHNAIRQKYQLGTRPYLLSVGTVQPRKNYSRIIQALAQLRAQNYDLSLVIAGGKGWLEGEMYQTIAKTGMKEYVHLIGFADDADLPVLYSAAACVVFPSLYEGFGFPVLEGMACGTPVITSNVSSLPEVAGDAALLINPVETDELTTAIQRIVEDADLRERLIQRGYQQIQHFTWANSAQHLYQIYQDILQR
jgi:glycosyltransferase involved in cell wall biosynthesis